MIINNVNGFDTELPLFAVGELLTQSSDGSIR